MVAISSLPPIHMRVCDVLCHSNKCHMHDCSLLMERLWINVSGWTPLIEEFVATLMPQQLPVGVWEHSNGRGYTFPLDQTSSKSPPTSKTRISVVSRMPARIAFVSGCARLSSPTALIMMLRNMGLTRVFIVNEVSWHWWSPKISHDAGLWLENHGWPSYDHRQRRVLCNGDTWTPRQRSRAAAHWWGAHRWSNRQAVRQWASRCSGQWHQQATSVFLLLLVEFLP